MAKRICSCKSCEVTQDWVKYKVWFKIAKMQSNVHSSVVVAAKEGTEEGQVAVRTGQMLVTNTHRPIIKVLRQRRGGLNFKTCVFDLVLSIWSAILGDITKIFLYYNFIVHITLILLSEIRDKFNCYFLFEVLY